MEQFKTISTHKSIKEHRSRKVKTIVSLCVLNKWNIGDGVLGLSSIVFTDGISLANIVDKAQGIVS